MTGRSLDELPHEILLSILAQLEKETSTLTVLLRVNRFFFHLVAPMLWADPFKTTNRCCMMHTLSTHQTELYRQAYRSVSWYISLYETLLDPILRIIFHPFPSLKFHDMHSRHAALLQEYDVPTAGTSFAQEQARPETGSGVFTAMADQNCQQQLNQHPSTNRPTRQDYLQYLESIDLRYFPACTKGTLDFRRYMPILKDSKLPQSVYQVLQTLLISRYPSKVQSLTLEAHDLHRQDSEAFSAEKTFTAHVPKEKPCDGLLRRHTPFSLFPFHQMANLRCLNVFHLGNDPVMWARLYACLAYHQARYGTLRELGLFMMNEADADENLNKVLRLVPRIEALRLRYRRETCQFHPERPVAPQYTWKGSTDVISGSNAAGNGTTSTASSGYWSSSSSNRTVCECCWQSSWYSDLPNTSLRILDIDYLGCEIYEPCRWRRWRDLARFERLEELHIQVRDEDMFEWILEEVKKSEEGKAYYTYSSNRPSLPSSAGGKRKGPRPLQHLKRLHLGRTVRSSFLPLQRCNVILGDQLEELSMWLGTPKDPNARRWRFHAPFPKLRALTLHNAFVNKLEISCIPIVAPRLEMLVLDVRDSRYDLAPGTPFHYSPRLDFGQWVDSELVPSLKQLQHLRQIFLDGNWSLDRQRFKNIALAPPRLELFVCKYHWIDIDSLSKELPSRIKACVM
ncbi:hypothetical protein BGZ73_007289 [Actinomortierella ambigua]|nr:hypothetical protein BGZ73_007289 [Actinomortierella ambigua]